MKLLDLYCSAGGAAMGYHRAGFEVIGVDKEPQPRYPFEFHQADALEYLAEHYREYDIIHASPPCQKYSRITRIISKKKHPDLLPATINALEATGKPYIVENVEGAPMENYFMLCGTMFGLKVFRHRLFVTKPTIFMSPMSCNHYDRSSNGGRNGDQRHPEAQFITVTGSVHPISKARRAMGIDWMNRYELTQAIPPPYTEWIGRQMLSILEQSKGVIMSTPTTIYTNFKTKFVYNTTLEEIKPLFRSGRIKETRVPIGEVHIFRYEIVDKVDILYDFSLCGKTRSEIGDWTKDSDKAPSQNVCPDCQRMYKEDSQSPWAKFTEGRAA